MIFRFIGKDREYFDPIGLERIIAFVQLFF